GTVFKINTDGSGFGVLYNFTALDSSYHNSDGFFPMATLVSQGSALFGTTASGGSNGYGTLFKINTDGSAFTVLHTFSKPDGVDCYGRLLLIGETLYGTTSGGGAGGYGTVFEVDTNGNSFALLHDFAAAMPPYAFGHGPHRGLSLSGHTPYATLPHDGNTSGFGAISKANPDG